MYVISFRDLNISRHIVEDSGTSHPVSFLCRTFLSLSLSMYTGSLHSMPGSASFEIYTKSQTFGKGAQW